MEKSPPIRNEKIMQVMIACTDRNAATAAKSLTSPAPIPFRKYTGNKMPRDTIMETADGKLYVTEGIGDSLITDMDVTVIHK